MKRSMKQKKKEEILSLENKDTYKYLLHLL